MKKRFLFLMFFLGATQSIFAAALQENDVDKQLIQAAHDGDVTKVRQLLAAGADVNAKTGRKKETALMQATYRGNTDVVKALLEDDAIDVNLKNYSGDTALIIAANKDYKDIVSLLLQAGADKYIRNKAGRGVFYYAGDEDVKTIIQNYQPGDIIITPELTTPEEREAARKLRVAIVYNKIDEVKQIVDEFPTLVHARIGRRGETALIMATIYKHPDLVRFLLTRGAERNVRNDGGFSPAELARHAKREDIFRLITEYPKTKGRAAFAFSAEEARKKGEPGLGELPQEMITEIGKYLEEE